MKRIGLLAFLTLALVMPFAVNTAAAAAVASNSTTVYANAASAGTATSFNGGVGTTTNTAATAWLLADQGGINSTFRNLTGTGVTNSFFSVVASTPLFSATMNSNLFSTGMTPTLIDVTTGKTVALTIDPLTGMYTFGALVSGQVYDLQVAYTIAATASVYTTITVAAIPEIEQWAMMLIGLFLIAVKVNKSKKSDSQLSHLCA